MKFNEDSRVKIPTILHLMKLGYSYLSLKDAHWDKNTNIFKDIFLDSIGRINPDLDLRELELLYQEVAVSLENEDLGRSFFEKLTETSGNKLIDFENFENNSFYVVTELPYVKDDEEFRPDVICLINGMPLVFIEVKKPNNREGVIAERNRIIKRFKNKKFQHFINITQFMIFSNNMEYDDGTVHPIQGAFYATTSYKKPKFNYFREEKEFDLNTLLQEVSIEEEDRVLQDNNLVSIKSSKEFQINKDPNTPTNRICTSLLQKERLSFLLKYAFAYVEEESGLQKHIMRYPQIFATMAISDTLENGISKGIIWHTQGSGKTALSFYNVKYLTDYFKTKNIVPKFYFIVDRLDLLKQASREFKARGLVVHTINSKEEFVRDIKSNSAIHNSSGKAEMTVVNIQKFQDDPNVTVNNDYNINIQRIYFLDEVHRSYNPQGSFLANLNESDPNAIKIGLTGTPLLGNDYNSRSLFGDYIHKYYYNKSIADGYTLKLIREEIETNYRLKLKKTLEEIQVLKGKTDRKKLYAHPKFVRPMLDYIIDDLEEKRMAMNDFSIGGMVICDSSDQAKEMYAIFNQYYADPKYKISLDEEVYDKAAETPENYAFQKDKFDTKTARLILHDIGSKQDRDDWIEDFKNGKIDFLFVYNMLLTGFDAPRLKKLYIGRVIKSHNLLQALTRVNRTYHDFEYGYVVDFADIQSEFEKTNQKYFNELQNELGDEMEHYSNLFKSPEEIEQDIDHIKDVLFQYDTQNLEIFQQQISQINDRKQILEIAKALNQAKSLYNIIRLTGEYELLKKLDFRKLAILSREANNRLALINTRDALENDLDHSNILNVALEDVVFAFTKVNEEEMVLADELKSILHRTRESLGGNFDPKDPEFISLKEELERLFKKKNLTEISKEEMEENIKFLDKIYEKSRELNRKNELLRAKYENDAKYTRLHKRLMEKNPLNTTERKLFEALIELKKVIDEQILSNAKQIENEEYIKRLMMPSVIDTLKKRHHLDLNSDITKDITTMMVNEYTNEYYGKAV